MPFWKNPEFVRYARAELRPARLLSTGLIVVVICSLVALSCWGAERKKVSEFFQLFYLWLMGMQFVVLGLWCGFACGQAIARERLLKTYDFQRTTRMTPVELMLGKILGAPILGWFALACSLPMSLLAGALAGYSAWVLFQTYVLLVAFALFFSLTALWFSLLSDTTNASAVSLLIILPMGPLMALAFSPFPGFGALSVLPGLLAVHDAANDLKRGATLFGLPVSFVFMTLFLYATFGAWLALMLKQNIKQELADIRLLSRHQAVGLAAFMNVLLYAFLDPGYLSAVAGGSQKLTPREMVQISVLLNGALLFLIGIATLMPHERLKVWWRRYRAGQESYLSPEGVGWPWLVASALIGYGMLLLAAFALRGRAPLEKWPLGTAAVAFLSFMIFIARDVLFLQWCALTHMKRPVVKGFLYLGLYYIAVLVIAIVSSLVSEKSGDTVWALLGPTVELDARQAQPTTIVIGLVLQVGLVLVILSAINGRLSRAPVAAPASAA